MCRVARLCCLLTSVVCGVVLSVAVPACGEEQSLEAQLRSIVTTNLEGLTEENLEKCLELFHPDGPGRKAADATMRQLFPVVDFKYELRGFKLVGTDEDYAVARIQQRTILVGEPKIPVQYKQSDIDLLTVFKKNKDGVWKFWTSTVLSSAVK